MRVKETWRWFGPNHRATSVPIIGVPVCVAPTGDVCGDGAVWHDQHEAVHWTDINRFLIHCFTPVDRCVRTRFCDRESGLGTFLYSISCTP